MGSPTIFSGKYTKLLTNKGILNSDGSLNQYDGQKNYIPYAQFEQNVTTGWGLFNTTLTSGLPTGSITAGASSLALTTTGTNPLAGAYSMQVAAASAWTAGHGVISDAFTIDRADLGKVLTIKFYYEATSGAANANWSGVLGSQTLGIYIYDVTASAWVQPAGFLGMVQSSNPGYVTATFQTSVTAGQQYRLAVLALQATASPVTITMDQVSVGPQTAPMAPAISDWKTYSLTIGGTTSAPTPGAGYSQSALWRRVGDSIEIEYTFSQTAAGSAGSGTYLFPLPPGLSIDTTKASVGTGAIGAGNTTLGTFTASSVTAASTPSASIGTVYGYNTTNLMLIEATHVINNEEPIGSTRYSLSGPTVYLTFRAVVPISGFSSNSVASADTDTRVVSFFGNNSSTQSVTANVTNIAVTAIRDTHGAWTGSTYVAPVAGDYVVGINTGDAAAAARAFELYINGTAIQRIGQTTTASGQLSTSFAYNLKGGDVISIRAKDTITLIANTYIYIFRLSGPAVITATDSVGCRYTDTSGQTIGTSAGIFKYNTKDFDSTNSYNSSTGLYTVPVSGKYKVSATVVGSVNLANTQSLNIYVYLNGAYFSRGHSTFGANTGGSTTVYTSANDEIDCVAGDTISIYALSSVSTTAPTSAGLHHLVIRRMGN